MSELRQTIQRYFLTALSIIIGLLALRFLLQLFGVVYTFPGGNILVAVTEPLLLAFVNIMPDWTLGSLIWSWTIVFAIAFWVVVGLILLDILLTLVDDDPIRISVNLVDAFLKIFEFLVISRFILVAFNASTQNVFTEAVFAFTGWARLGLGEFNVLGGRVEIGTMLAFVLLVIIDIFWEGLADKYIVAPRKIRQQTKTTTTTTKTESRPSTPITVVVPAQQASPSVTMLSKQQFEELRKEMKK